jgi:hypothetical protein
MKKDKVISMSPTLFTFNNNNNVLLVQFSIWNYLQQKKCININVNFGKQMPNQTKICYEGIIYYLIFNIFDNNNTKLLYLIGNSLAIKKS